LIPKIKDYDKKNATFVQAFASYLKLNNSAEVLQHHAAQKIREPEAPAMSKSERSISQFHDFSVAQKLN
jgi:hypothetical protein